MHTALKTRVVALVAAMGLVFAPVAQARPSGYTQGEWNAICGMRSVGQVTSWSQQYWNGQWLAWGVMYGKLTANTKINKRFWPDARRKTMVMWWRDGYPVGQWWKTTEEC